MAILKARFKAGVVPSKDGRLVMTRFPCNRIERRAKKPRNQKQKATP
jgi:hypothetical protein